MFLQIALFEVEVVVSREADLDRAASIIEECFSNEGLVLTMKTTLLKYPSSSHWHYKKGKLGGTLEITLWKHERRILFTVQARRKGGWQSESIKRLGRSISMMLKKSQASRSTVNEN